MITLSSIVLKLTFSRYLTRLLLVDFCGGEEGDLDLGLYQRKLISTYQSLGDLVTLGFIGTLDGTYVSELSNGGEILWNIVGTTALSCGDCLNLYKVQLSI